VPELGELNITTILGLPLGLGGLFLIVRVMWGFNANVTERYAVRVREQADHIDNLEADLRARDIELTAIHQRHYQEMSALQRRYQACVSERQALRYAVQQAGIKWDTQSWDLSDGT
jgi:hypothetical protein